MAYKPLDRSAEGLLTIRQVAKLLEAPIPTVESWVRKRRLPATKYGFYWLIRKEDCARPASISQPIEAGWESLQQAAKTVGVSAPWLRRAIALGKIEYKRYRQRHFLVPLAALRELVKTRQKITPAKIQVLKKASEARWKKDKEQITTDKPLHATIILRNNRLLSRRQALDLSQQDIAAMIGISVPHYSMLERLYVSPINKKIGDWKSIAKKTALFFDERPEHLWPEEIQNLRGPSKFEKTFDTTDTPGLFGVGNYTKMMLKAPDDYVFELDVRSAVTALQPREQEIINARFGLNEKKTENTLEEVAHQLGVTRERIRQIESLALKKLKKQLQEKPKQT